MMLQKNTASLPGKIFFRMKREIDRLKKETQLRFPQALGMPIKAPVIQLYRCDHEINTQINLVNYLSFYNHQIESSILYEIVVFNRVGKRIARGVHKVAPFQTLMKPIQDLVSELVDEYGVFYIKAKYEPQLPTEARYLGETSPQFMTLFLPKLVGAPQMIHSHKFFERFPAPYTPTTRISSSIEETGNLESLSFYVLNSSSSKVRGAITFSPLTSQSEILTKLKFEIPRHGVKRLVMTRSDLGKLSESVAIQYEYDRVLSHMKPIQFRTFKGGFITANHS